MINDFDANNLFRAIFKKQTAGEQTLGNAHERSLARSHARTHAATLYNQLYYNLMLVCHAKCTQRYKWDTHTHTHAFNWRQMERYSDTNKYICECTLYSTSCIWGARHKLGIRVVHKVRYILLFFYQTTILFIVQQSIYAIAIRNHKTITASANPSLVRLFSSLLSFSRFSLCALYAPDFTFRPPFHYTYTDGSFQGNIP